MTSPDTSAKFPLSTVVLLTLVAALLATTIWFGAGNQALQAKVAALETERDLAKADRELALGQLRERTLIAEESINDLGRKLEGRANPARRTVIRLRPTDPSAGVGGILLWYPLEKAGLLVALGLPALGSEQRYEFQVASPGTAPAVNAPFEITANGVTLVDFLPGSLPDFAPELVVTVATASASGSKPVLSSK